MNHVVENDENIEFVENIAFMENNSVVNEEEGKITNEVQEVHTFIGRDAYDLIEKHKLARVISKCKKEYDACLKNPKTELKKGKWVKVLPKEGYVSKVV